MHFYIWTVGCQMNRADSERMASALENMGLNSTTDVKEADVIILNSCSVRQSAEERILGKLGSIRHLKRRPKSPIIILAGCMVGEDTEDLHQRLPYVDAFVRPSDVDAVIDAVNHHIRSQSHIEFNVCVSEPNDRHLGVDSHHALQTSQNSSNLVARWVPIIYGCNNFCSYCIVPYRRGRERSRPVDEVVAEVRNLVAAGAREVTLLGQNVDSYGRDLPGKPDLAALLCAIEEIDNLYRIRFLTSHPKDMSVRLMQAVASLSKVCEHINLPVQHGDDDVLRAMRRGYTSQQYRDLVTQLRHHVPDISLSTDVIVGYPGESEQQYQRTYDLLEEIRFDVVHAAMFSPRQGTRAAQLPDDVPPEEKKRRLNLIEQLQEKTAADTNQALKGTITDVLVEDRHKGKLQGRTRTNKLVFLDGDDSLVGKLVDVRIEHTTAWSLQGTYIETETNSNEQICIAAEERKRQ